MLEFTALNAFDFKRLRMRLAECKHSMNEKWDILAHEKLTLEEFEKQWYFALGWQRRIPERAMIGLDIGYDD